MGNKNGGFKGEGHSLMSDEKIPAKKNVKKSSKKPQPKSTEEIAAQRAKQMEAAEKRGKAWDERVQRGKEQRLKEQKAKEEQFVQGSGTAMNSAKEHLEKADDGTIKKQIEKDAKKLETSGFNIFQSATSTSTQARTLINLDGLSSEDEICEKLLEASIESCDLDSLQQAIKRVDKNKFQTKYQAKYDTAMELLTALKATKKQDDNSSTANNNNNNNNNNKTGISDELMGTIDEILQHSTLDPTAAKTTMKTLIKLLDNVHNNPTEEKFRKIRLENPAIKKKLVQFADGTPVKILEELGFTKLVEENEQILKLSDENLSSIFTVKYNGIRTTLNQFLENLSSSE